MFAALGVAATLTLAGVIASRAYGEPLAGAALAAYSLPYAFVGGALLVATGDPNGPVPGLAWIGAAELLVGSAALLLHGSSASSGWAPAGGCSRARSPPACSVRSARSPGSCSPPRAPRPSSSPSWSAASACCRCSRSGSASCRCRRSRCRRPRGGGGVHRGAVRLRRGPGAARPRGRLRRGRAHRGVADRHADRSRGARDRRPPWCSSPPAGSRGGCWSAVAAAALLLRSRLFVTVRQRVPLLAGGLAGATVLGGLAGRRRWGAGRRGGVPGRVGDHHGRRGVRRRAPAPYLGRAADLLDTALVVSVVPVACAVLGLYGRPAACSAERVRARRPPSPAGRTPGSPPPPRRGRPSVAPSTDLPGSRSL